MGGFTVHPILFLILRFSLMKAMLSGLKIRFQADIFGDWCNSIPAVKVRESR